MLWSSRREAVEPGEKRIAVSRPEPVQRDLEELQVEDGVRSNPGDPCGREHDRQAPLITCVTAPPEEATTLEALDLLRRGAFRDSQVARDVTERDATLEVDQVVTVFEPERRLEWRHEAERFGGHPALRFSAETVFSISLEGQGSDATRVALTSRQTPVDPDKEAAMRSNSEYLGQMFEASLERLADVVAAQPRP